MEVCQQLNICGNIVSYASCWDAQHIHTFPHHSIIPDCPHCTLAPCLSIGLLHQHRGSCSTLQKKLSKHCSKSRSFMNKFTTKQINKKSGREEFTQWLHYKIQSQYILQLLITFSCSLHSHFTLPVAQHTGTHHCTVLLTSIFSQFLSSSVPPKLYSKILNLMTNWFQKNLNKLNFK